MTNSGKITFSENKYGRLEFEGKAYNFTDDADFTSRLLGYGTDYNDVDKGEEFEFEMVAPAIGEDGKKYRVYWIFSDIKGEGEKELDQFDYDEVDRIELD